MKTTKDFIAYSLVPDLSNKTQNSLSSNIPNKSCRGNCRLKAGKKTPFKAFCEVHKKAHLMPSDNLPNMIALKVEKLYFSLINGLAEQDDPQ